MNTQSIKQKDKEEMLKYFLEQNEFDTREFKFDDVVKALNVNCPRCKSQRVCTLETTETLEWTYICIACRCKFIAVWENLE